MIEWSTDLDLSEFYRIAESKGFTNNASRKMLVDCFNNEREKQVWILYYNDTPVGSVAAHSFDQMGENCYRIAARTCVFSDMIPTPSLRTRNQIVTHQHVTSQFLIPTCIDWCPKDSRMFITSNENETGTQRLVHNIFGPAMQETGQMKKVCDLFYRGTNQTVWELFPGEFYKELNKYPRWI